MLWLFTSTPALQPGRRLAPPAMLLDHQANGRSSKGSWAADRGIQLSFGAWPMHLSRISSMS